MLVDGTLTAGGTLEVLLDGYSPVLGDSFALFGFSAATGGFDFSLPALAGELAWDTSSLLTTGELSVVASIAENADFDGDGDVDGRDFLIWQRGFGLADQEDNSLGDADGSGTVDAGDLAVWQTQYGNSSELLSASVAVPEPSALVLAGIVVGLLSAKRRVARFCRRPERVTRSII